MAVEVPSDIAEIYRWVIGGLLGAISILAGVVGVQWKHTNTLHNARDADKEKMHSLMEANTTAINSITELSKARATVHDRVAELMDEMTVAIQLLTERLSVQHEHSNRDVEHSIEAVKALSEAIRSLNLALATSIAEIKGEIKKLQ